MVTHPTESLHLIKLESKRWRAILEPAYRSYKLQMKK